MKKPEDVTSERVDDIPLLLAQLEKMKIQELLDRHFPTHGNWKGLSLGYIVVVWLSYILSQADHRLSYVEDWIEKRQKTLLICLKQRLTGLEQKFCPNVAQTRFISKEYVTILVKPFHKTIGYGGTKCLQSFRKTV